METNKNTEAIQQEILKLLDGLPVSSAKVILHKLLGELDHTAIIKVPS